MRVNATLVTTAYNASESRGVELCAAIVANSAVFAEVHVLYEGDSHAALTFESRLKTMHMKSQYTEWGGG